MSKQTPIQSFLDLCADHLIQHYSTELPRLSIVLPTRRSGLVLENLLRQKGISQDLSITPIENFIYAHTQHEKSSSVLLLLELYDIFKSIDPKISLDKFTSWGYILLKDFDQIDRNLVDAQQLFQNLADIKNIERWQVDHQNLSPRIQEYFRLWENLQATYTRYREHLKSRKLAYPGMLYRHLAENTREILLAPNKVEKYIFIGFNALSKSEEKIFKTLMDEGKAEIVWDADPYYMKEGAENKAGQFLRKYQKNWSGTNWKYQSDYLASSEKDIQIISVANASLQAKVANQLLKNWLPEDTKSLVPTALVLGDEHLLLPSLHALDKDFQGLNISMGLSLKDSALFNLVDILFEQRESTIKDPESGQRRFSHRSIVKILTHPFVRQYERKKVSAIEDENYNLLLLLIHSIHKNNLIFLSQEDLMELMNSDSIQEKRAEEPLFDAYWEAAREVLIPLFEVLFQYWSNTFDLLEVLEKLSDLLVYEENQIEFAYFEEFSKVLRQLKGFVSLKPTLIGLKTFKIFLYQAFRETRFDFDSDRDSNLQLMGIIETRNLDFENVIILSVNENSLPRSKRVNSFIPLDVARAFELPTYSEQDAVISYHFYRLLQRAQQIALIYVAPSDTYGGKEKSRFILQIENDLKYYNPKIKIQEIPAKFRAVEAFEEKELIFEKDEALQTRIKELFKKGLSPSHINSFLRCSLQFYFRQIAEIGAKREVQEILGADKLGTLLHEILEDLFLEMTQNSPWVGSKELEAVLPGLADRVEVKLASDQYAQYEMTGQNYIFKTAVTRSLIQFIEAQIQEVEKNKAPFEILSVERNSIRDQSQKSQYAGLSVDTRISLGEEDITLKLKGITDRVDRVQGNLRIVDYKTGNMEARFLKVSKKSPEEFTWVEDPQKDKIRQLWLYQYMAFKQIDSQGGFKVGDKNIKEAEHLKVGIYSLRKPESGFMEIQDWEKEENKPLEQDLKSFVQSSEQYLGEILQKILDPKEPFAPTQNHDTCTFCAYKEICGR